jgi:hypothetical protein
MFTTDVEPKHFKAAKVQVKDHINELGGGEHMTLIMVGHTPEELA